MPASASAISPRPPTRAASPIRAPRRCRASRRCAHNLGARPRPGHVPAPPAARTATGWPRSARASRTRRTIAARRRLLGLGDVGGQCGDRLARARHGRRPLPPHRRQSADHGASQPRMAGDARPAPPRLRRRRAFRRPRAGARRPSATRARPITCGSAPRHGAPGVEIFVYGVRGGAFPARQHVEASRAVARLHGLDPERTLFVAQSEEAIAAGAFHNDVVAVANETCAVRARAGVRGQGRLLRRR